MAEGQRKQLVLELGGKQRGEGHLAGAEAVGRVNGSTLANTMTSLSSYLLGSHWLSLTRSQRGGGPVDAFH